MYLLKIVPIRLLKILNIEFRIVSEFLRDTMAYLPNVGNWIIILVHDAFPISSNEVITIGTCNPNNVLIILMYEALFALARLW